MKRSRRRFLRLLAAGSAAAAMAPAAALAGAAPRSRKPAPKPPAGAVAAPGRAVTAAEILRQKKLVEATLKTIRDYPLPPGSEPAFVFAPLKARKRTWP